MYHLRTIYGDYWKLYYNVNNLSSMGNFTKDPPVPVHRCNIGSGSVRMRVCIEDGADWWGGLECLL